MTTNNLGIYSLKIISELIKDIVYFPVWWYSFGFFKFVIILLNFLSGQQKSLALIIWIKNIFRPMYGQSDWQGMLISFFMRLVQIVFRGIILLVWMMLALLAAIFWLILPPLVAYEIIFQLYI